MWPFKKSKSIALGVPGSGKSYKIYDFNERECERLYVEYLLKRLWFKNKDEKDIFSFEPINIMSEERQYFIDAIRYDTAPRDEHSLAAFLSTASDDKLQLHGYKDIADAKFVEACCFRTGELINLLYGLQKYNISSIK